MIWVTVPMQKRGAEAPAVRDSARRKRGEQKSEQAAVQITTIVSLTEATEGSKKCPVKASRRRSSNGCSLLLTAYGPGRICSEAWSEAPGKGGTPVRGILAAAVVSLSACSCVPQNRCFRAEHRQHDGVWGGQPPMIRFVCFGERGRNGRRSYCE